MELLTKLVTAAAVASIPLVSTAISFQSAPSPNLDLSHLGRVALAGDFDGISLYQFVGQQESRFSANGSQSLLAQYQSGAFADLLASDAAIEAMCSFTQPNGTLIGLVVAGNFTSLGGERVQAAALVDPNSLSVTSLTGLTGQVSTVYCDNERSTVYVGGQFTGANSSNAIAWTTGWTNLPFSGFNGPVNSIAKLPSGNIVFGGSFSGIASSPNFSVPDAQTINLVSANITASPASNISAYSSPSNIVCKTDQQDGPGNSWIAEDNSPGSWSAAFGFGFVPTKLRLYQSKLADHGVKTWRYTALPLNGIMNFTYYDQSGELQSCTSECPLPEGNLTAQDFHFVNYVGMNAFRIDVSAWYGQGAGLGGIELFENDIFTYAINEFNEPVCDDVSRIGSNSTTKGDWQVTTAAGVVSSYLTTRIPAGTNNSSPASMPNVTFYPDIKQAGNYTIMIYTPGCIADNTCDGRGIVNITGQLSASRPAMDTVQLYQSNYYEKYDTVFNGYVDAASSDFRPSITLVPTTGQAKSLVVVAERVQFMLTASTGGLNGLYEYDPGVMNPGTDFNSSAINKVGNSLSEDATVKSLVVVDSDVYVGGQFSTSSFSNIFAIRNGTAASLPNGGVNNAVSTMYNNGSLLYVAGNFTNSQDNQVSGLNGVAAYQLSQNQWLALGAGVNGPVHELVPIDVQTSDGHTVQGIAASGFFTQINAFGGNPSVNVQDLAVWVPSRNNWLQNLGNEGSLSGRLSAFATVPGSENVYAGNVQSQALSANGVVSLESTSGLSLQSLPIELHPNVSTTSVVAKRDVATVPIEGVVTGLFYTGNNLNITVLGGHFTTTGTNGSTVYNLAFINGSDSNHIGGLTTNSSSSAAVIALDTQGTTLYAGGSIDGGLVVYDLRNQTLQFLPPISGRQAVVNAIAARPSSSQVYVGGDFDTAGALPCVGLCVYDSSGRQWNPPSISSGSGLGSDSSVNALKWADNDVLAIAGNFTAGGNASTFAFYDARTATLHTVPGSADTSNIPGPITSFTNTDSSYLNFFVSGTSTTGAPFISRFSSAKGSTHQNPQGTWTTITGLDSSSIISSVQIFMLTASHGSSSTIDADQALLVFGQLSLPTYGNVSAALYNGTSFVPFADSTTTSGAAGTLRRAFVENPANFLVRSAHHLALGLVVLIGLAIALALTFLVVVGGIVAERIRRRRQGYVRAPPYSPAAYEKGPNIGAIQAEQLFSRVGEPGGGTAPRI